MENHRNNHRKRLSSHMAIHHSDRGIQYCSAHYQDLLESNQITPSMTDGDDCYQNALAERINGILKQEFLFNRCANKQDLAKLVAESVYIYNNERPHLSLQMHIPSEIHKKAEEETLPRP